MPREEKKRHTPAHFNVGKESYSMKYTRALYAFGMDCFNELF